MKGHLLLLFLFGILNAYPLTHKHEEESMESFIIDETDSVLRPSLGSRIINGDEAGINDYPWMASMRRWGGHFCGGALISLTHVLTARHCFWWLEPKNSKRYRRLMRIVTVVLGDHYIKTTECEEQKFGIADYLALKENTNKSGVPCLNDVAVVKLNGAATPNSYVSTIGLPNSPIALSPGDELTIAGWGIAKFYRYDPVNGVKFSPQSNFLRVTQLKIIENKDCINVYDILGKANGDVALARPAGEDVICTVEDYGKGYIESGDSGSPVLYHDPITKTWVLVAIISYGTGRSGEDGNANVSYFLNEINAMVADLEKDNTGKLLVGPQNL